VVKLDGVEIRECAELGIGLPSRDWGVVAHELGHLLLNLPDMYQKRLFSTSAAQYSLMDQHGPHGHLDPFNKLKLGFAQPRLVFRDGNYAIPDIETHHRVYVLLDRKHDTDEYFLVENRWDGESYDDVVFDQGLGVWHIMESASDYDSAPVPYNVTNAEWGELGTGNGSWGRKAWRMLRPQLSPVDDNRALWHQGESDLLSSGPSDRAALRWANGSESGFGLRNFGPAAPNLTVTIDVP
jgi:M6 family metalloprotease-like protein